MLGTNTRVPTLATNRLKGRGGSGADSPPPSALALDPDTFAQAAPSGTTVGTLSATDPAVGATHTYTVVGSTEFTAVGALLKTADTFADEVYYFRDLDIKIDSSSGASATKPAVVYITPTDTSNDSGQPAPGDGTPTPTPPPEVVYSPNFPVPPMAVNADGVLKITGKSGGLAKIIIDIGPPTAGKSYLAKWSADWSQLSKLGKKAFVGFGYRKANDDFHFIGWKGDAGTGVRVTAISATSTKKFNGKGTVTDYAVTDYVPATGYTQSGPNWGQLAVAADGRTYDLADSLDGAVLTTVVDDAIPAPLNSVADAAQFGFAIFLESDDKGPFSVSLEVWDTTATGYGRQYGKAYGEG